jgi:hypothetical protein
MKSFKSSTRSFSVETSNIIKWRSLTSFYFSLSLFQILWDLYVGLCFGSFCNFYMNWQIPHFPQDSWHSVRPLVNQHLHWDNGKRKTLKFFGLLLNISYIAFLDQESLSTRLLGTYSLFGPPNGRKPLKWGSVFMVHGHAFFIGDLQVGWKYLGIVL